MQMPDVNILVYAHRRDESTHSRYLEWLEDLVNGCEPFGLSVLAAVGFIRIVTNSRIFAEPTPLPVALATVETLLAHPRCRMLLPGPQHWELVRQLCSGAEAKGKLVADAQHAAIAIEHGCELVTRDTDFRRFSGLGLRWRHLVFL
jgi:toxin-antitoxin system PIN domain toxin